MSVKFGHLLEGQRTTLVGGAPRSRGHGQVIMFTVNDTSKEINPKQYLNGDQLGSGFGYDFAIGDFNGDGLV